jgi:hypothetical protein
MLDGREAGALRLEMTDLKDADSAHLLLQVRCAVMDGRLDQLYRERYPMSRVMAPAVSTALM